MDSRESLVQNINAVATVLRGYHDLARLHGSPTEDENKARVVVQVKPLVSAKSDEAVLHVL